MEVNLDEIAKYINSLSFKKKVVGGVDEAEALLAIKQLSQMYEKLYDDIAHQMEIEKARESDKDLHINELEYQISHMSQMPAYDDSEKKAFAIIAQAEREAEEIRRKAIQEAENMKNQYGSHLEELRRLQQETLQKISDAKDLLQRVGLLLQEEGGISVDETNKGGPITSVNADTPNSVNLHPQTSDFFDPLDRKSQNTEDSLAGLNESLQDLQLHQTKGADSLWGQNTENSYNKSANRYGGSQTYQQDTQGYQSAPDYRQEANGYQSSNDYRQETNGSQMGNEYRQEPHGYQNPAAYQSSSYQNHTNQSDQNTTPQSFGTMSGQGMSSVRPQFDTGMMSNGPVASMQSAGAQSSAMQAAHTASYQNAPQQSDGYQNTADQGATVQNMSAQNVAAQGSGVSGMTAQNTIPQSGTAAAGQAENPDMAQALKLLYSVFSNGENTNGSTNGFQGGNTGRPNAMNGDGKSIG